MLKKTWLGLAAIVAVAIIAVTLRLSHKESSSADTRQAFSRAHVEVGVVLPLTGPTARYGRWIKNALELARDEHNQNPANRYDVRYQFEDDHGKTEAAVSATQKLISVQRVPAIFGTWSSSGVLGMIPVVQTAGIVLMADAVSPQIRNAGKWVFRCVPDAKLSLDILKEPIMNRGYKRLAILYINNDFGKDLADYVANLLGVGPPRVVFAEGYPADTADFGTIVEKVKTKGPDALVVIGYAEQGQLIKKTKELALNVPIYASPSFENVDILAQAGAAADGVIYSNYFDPNSEVRAMKEFIAKYHSYYGERAEGFGASAYTGMQALLRATERCPTPVPENIRANLRDLGRFGTVFGDAYIDETGDIRYPIFLKTVAKGEFVRASP